MDDKAWQPKLNHYVDETLEADFHTFPEQCFRGRENEMQRELLVLLHNYYLALTGRVS